MQLTDIVMSVVSGGVTGLLGSVITLIAGYKTKQLELEGKKLDRDHEIALRHADARIIELEWQSREKIAMVETEGRMDIADSAAFQVALQNEPKQYANPSKFTKMNNSMMVFLDFIRGSIRPGLTLYLCAITTAVWMQAGDIIKSQPIPVEAAVDIYTQITMTVLYLTTTSVLFWFGTRVKEQKINNRLV